MLPALLETMLPPAPRFPCQCCRHAVLTEPTPGSHATCPICYWTDTDLTAPADREALFQARRCYATSGASDRGWLGAVRPATTDEPSAVDGVIAIPTSPRDDAATEVRDAIERAFADVSPAGRITLRDADRADSYGQESDYDWDDHDTAWDRIPGEVLDYYGRIASVFTYGNVASFRYYLPAYMCHALGGGETFAVLAALDARRAPGDGQPPIAGTLDHAQRQAVVAFLRFVIDFLGPNQHAERALERIWLVSLTAPDLGPG